MRKKVGSVITTTIPIFKSFIVLFLLFSTLFFTILLSKIPVVEAKPNGKTLFSPKLGCYYGTELEEGNLLGLWYGGAYAAHGTFEDEKDSLILNASNVDSKPLNFYTPFNNSEFSSDTNLEYRIQRSNILVELGGYAKVSGQIRYNKMYISRLTPWTILITNSTTYQIKFDADSISNTRTVAFPISSGWKIVTSDQKNAYSNTIDGSLRYNFLVLWMHTWEGDQSHALIVYFNQTLRRADTVGGSKLDLCFKNKPVAISVLYLNGCKMFAKSVVNGWETSFPSWVEGFAVKALPFVYTLPKNYTVTIQQDGKYISATYTYEFNCYSGTARRFAPIPPILALGKEQGYDITLPSYTNLNITTYVGSYYIVDQSTSVNIKIAMPPLDEISVTGYLHSDLNPYVNALITELKRLDRRSYDSADLAKSSYIAYLIPQLQGSNKKWAINWVQDSAKMMLKSSKWTKKTVGGQWYLYSYSWGGKGEIDVDWGNGYALMLIYLASKYASLPTSFILSNWTLIKNIEKYFDLFYDWAFGMVGLGIDRAGTAGDCFTRQLVGLYAYSYLAKITNKKDEYLKSLFMASTIAVGKYLQFRALHNFYTPNDVLDENYRKAVLDGKKAFLDGYHEQTGLETANASNAWFYMNFVYIGEPMMLQFYWNLLSDETMERHDAYMNKWSDWYKPTSGGWDGEMVVHSLGLQSLRGVNYDNLLNEYLIMKNDLDLVVKPLAIFYLNLRKTLLGF